MFNNKVRGIYQQVADEKPIPGCVALILTHCFQPETKIKVSEYIYDSTNKLLIEKTITEPTTLVRIDLPDDMILNKYLLIEIMASTNYKKEYAYIRKSSCKQHIHITQYEYKINQIIQSEPTDWERNKELTDYFLKDYQIINRR